MNNKWQNAVRSMEQRMESLRLNMHGYQILYRGELIGERYWEPFHRDSLHRMYSITKSFTSLATGLLAAEGKIGLDDLALTVYLYRDLYVFAGKAAGGWRTSMVRRNDDPGFTYDAYLL